MARIGLKFRCHGENLEISRQSIYYSPLLHGTLHTFLNQIEIEIKKLYFNYGKV